MIFQVGANFKTALDYMQTWGFADAILPFLLFFGLLFAVLQKVKLFKTKKGTEEIADRKMNGVIAFVIAMMIVVPHVIGGIYPPGADPVNIINNILPASAIIIFAIVMILIIVGLMETKDEPGKSPIARLAGLAGVIILATLFLANLFPTIGLRLGFLKDPGMQALLVVIGIFGVVVWFITKEEPDTPYKWLHDILGGK